jgi:hypothetical protein
VHHAPEVSSLEPIATVFAPMQDKVFPLNLAFNVGHHLKFIYEVPNWIMPKQIALNQTMWSQTKACIVKSSCKISALVRYYAVWTGNS